MRLFPFIVVSAGLLFWSCQSRDSLTVETEITSASVTKSVDLNNVASKYSVSSSDAMHYSELYHPERVYSLTSYVVSKDTLLYVLNYKDGGWMVVPGDRRYESD